MTGRSQETRELLWWSSPWPTPSVILSEGVLYKGTCNICAMQNITAVYYGETGFSAYYREGQHDKVIRSHNLENAFAKHLSLFHPEADGDTTLFTIKVVKSFSKPLPRHVTEAVMIAKARSDTSIISLNSRAEFRQPAIPSVIVTRELQVHNRRQRRRGRGRRRQHG